MRGKKRKNTLILFSILVDGHVVLEIGWVDTLEIGWGNTLENRVREREHMDMDCGTKIV